MAIQKTEAIILKTQPFRSSSLLVTLFSRDFGKIKGIAKGVRLEREMRGAMFELFSHVEIVFYEKTKSDLHLISEVFILDSFEPVRSSLESITYASYFADLVDQLTEFHDPHAPIFHLLQFAYRFLPSMAPEKLSRLFEIQLAKEVGWLPYLDGCVQCSKKSPAEPFFSPMQGGLYCPECAPAIQDARTISPETLSLLKYYIQHDPEQSIKQALTSQTEQGLALLMEKFLNARLHRPLKSRIFLEKIRPVLG